MVELVIVHIKLPAGTFQRVSQGHQFLRSSVLGSARVAFIASRPPQMNNF